ncbi:MAG: 5-methyltetrahydropteroyltriglutamate--homocysteine S-methyltransferase [Breznakibacter sp.]
MQTHNLGYPRIGSRRELKKACERFWAGQSTLEQLLQAARELRHENWTLQRDAGLSWIPVNDFSLYDHVLDTCTMVGCIPPRFKPLAEKGIDGNTDLYFSMARGCQANGIDATAMEMTKWFDTNYHYIVPEFRKGQTFKLSTSKAVAEFTEAKTLGINPKPVLLGPVSFLLLGKEKEEGFHRLDLLPSLIEVYAGLLKLLRNTGATWVQIDEPCLVTDLDDQARQAYRDAYRSLAEQLPGLNLMLTTYFGHLGDNTELAFGLPVAGIHIDMASCPEQYFSAIRHWDTKKHLSLGIVDGRNVWKNDYAHSLKYIQAALAKTGSDKLWLAPSCSLMHVPCDLDLERESLPREVQRWMAFARQKLSETTELALLAEMEHPAGSPLFIHHTSALSSRVASPVTNNPQVKQRTATIQPAHYHRGATFLQRKAMQQDLGLPVLPTTTIGSFPQTAHVRQLRLQLKKGEITIEAYQSAIKDEIREAIRFQEEIGLDVLVHGEFERNDMVEYFGRYLHGFAVSDHGWVQSYGTRCVKPPIIYGDIWRMAPMTVEWIRYAQSLTSKPMKGMLTGPVTILQWSFVRNDQPRSATALQIALAVRDEVADLEKAGTSIIQVDEPALREGLPLRKADRPAYLQWAVNAFRLAVSSAAPSTQVHTHMCYSEFSDIMEAVANMDADVVTIETSRSQMELMDVFRHFEYPNDIGPGIYDIHSPRVPSEHEMTEQIYLATRFVPIERLWVNPDCGLKTRGWDETRQALRHMVAAARKVREAIV